MIDENSSFLGTNAKKFFSSKKGNFLMKWLNICIYVYHWIFSPWTTHSLWAIGSVKCQFKTKKTVLGIPTHANLVFLQPRSHYFIECASNGIFSSKVSFINIPVPSPIIQNRRNGNDGIGICLVLHLSSYLQRHKLNDVGNVTFTVVGHSSD